MVVGGSVRRTRPLSKIRLSRIGQTPAGWKGRDASVGRRQRRLRRSPTDRLPRVLPGEFARDVRLAKIEAVLFLAREPMATRKLAQLAGLADGTEARTLIRRLNRLYDGSGCAFRAEEVGGGFQLMSRVKFGSWLRRLFESPIEARLSAPALETLAIVAYRQPVMRTEVDALRGVDCSEILRQLMERELVRIAGRSQELGRPYYYGTTKRFLQVFGLRNLDDLPRSAALRRRATGGAEVSPA
jgi:segregation and condensation protein B